MVSSTSLGADPRVAAEIGQRGLVGDLQLVDHLHHAVGAPGQPGGGHPVVGIGHGAGQQDPALVDREGDVGEQVVIGLEELGVELEPDAAVVDRPGEPLLRLRGGRARRTGTDRHPDRRAAGQRHRHRGQHGQGECHAPGACAGRALRQGSRRIGGTGERELLRHRSVLQ